MKLLNRGDSKMSSFTGKCFATLDISFDLLLKFAANNIPEYLLSIFLTSRHLQWSLVVLFTVYLAESA